MGFFLLPYECICLLGVGLLSSIAAFSYFPFATTVLPTYLGATSAQVAAIIGFAVFAGNVGAYFVSIYSNANNLLQRLRSSLLMIAASLLIMVLAHAAGSTYQAAVATISLIMYRYAIGMVSNTSRALQIKYLPDNISRSKIFSYMKFAAAGGGLIGPILGAAVLGREGFGAVTLASCVMFACCSAALYKLQNTSTANEDKSRRKVGWSGIIRQDSRVYLTSAAGMLHYIFEAQIYTYISLNLKSSSVNGAHLISILFSSNALFLVVLTVPVLHVAGRFGRRRVITAGASLMSLLAIVLSGKFGGAGWAIALSFLFTIGEIITPQVLIDIATSYAPGKETIAPIATFNFFTAGVGLSIGYWLGGAAFQHLSYYEAVAMWIAVYSLYLLMLGISAKWSPSARDNNYIDGLSIK
jgi:MFS family permease